MHRLEKLLTKNSKEQIRMMLSHKHKVDWGEITENQKQIVELVRKCRDKAV